MTPILFTTTNCAYCPSVKKYLDSKGVTYEVRNLDGDEIGYSILRDLTGRTTVPTLWTDKGVAVGLNYREINRIIDIS